MKTHKKSVGVLIPIFNEEKTVKKIISRIIELAFVSEIIAVDDHSTDTSLKIIKQLKSSKLTVYTLPFNQGKAAALKFAVSKSKSEILIIQDADLEYDPAEMKLVLEPIIANKADVVYGSRFLVRKMTRVLYFNHYIANKLLTLLSNSLTNLNMSDIETCYKAFRRPILVNLPFKGQRFGFEVEITAMISKLPIKIYEVPISYYGRTYEEGKKITSKDGLLALWYALYFNIWAVKTPEYQRYLQKTSQELKEVKA